MSYEYIKGDGEMIFAVSLDMWADSPRDLYGNEDSEWHIVCYENRSWNLPKEYHESMTRDELVESDEYDVQPLSFYNHGNVKLFAGEVSDWDTAVAGYAWRKKNDTFYVSDEAALDCLDAVLKEYTCYLNGDCWYVEAMDYDGNVEDCCYGFYAEDPKEVFDMEAYGFLDMENLEDVNVVTTVTTSFVAA